MAEDKKIEKSNEFAICIPSNLISSQTPNLDQLTQVAYNIARAACTFRISEVILLEAIESNDDDKENDNKSKQQFHKSTLLLASLLQFFITPPYLVSNTFETSPISTKNFKLARKFPTIPNLPFLEDTLNHSRYKEGISINKNKIGKREKTSSGKVKKLRKEDKTTKFVNIGREKLIELKEDLPLNVRVTVDTIEKKIVSPKEAYGSEGTNGNYGYTIRIAKKLVDVFTESGFDDGYDVSYYVNAGDYFDNAKEWESKLSNIKNFNDGDANSKKILIVVDKWSNLVRSFKECGIEGETSDLFDGYVSIPSKCRIEDGVLISLTKVCM